MIHLSYAHPIVCNLFQGKLTALLIQAPKFCDVLGIPLHSISTGLLNPDLLLTALHRPASCPYVKQTLRVTYTSPSVILEEVSTHSTFC